MKYFTTPLVFLTCLLLSITSVSYAAFPIQTQKAAATVSKQTSLNAVAQNTQTSPKEPLINPEHQMGDILSLASLLMGIVGIIVSISSGIGAVLGILAIVMSVASMHMDTGHLKIAQWGLAAGIVATIVGIIVALS